MIRAASLLLALLATSEATQVPGVLGRDALDKILTPETRAAASAAHADLFAKAQAGLEISRAKARSSAQTAASKRTAEATGLTKGRRLGSLPNQPASTGTFSYFSNYINASQCGGEDYPAFVSASPGEGLGLTGCMGSENAIFDADNESAYLYCNADGGGVNFFASDDCTGTVLGKFNVSTADTPYGVCDENGTALMCGQPNKKDFNIGYNIYAVPTSMASEACDDMANVYSAIAYHSKCELALELFGIPLYYGFSCDEAGISMSIYLFKCSADYMMNQTTIIAQTEDECVLEGVGSGIAMKSQVTCGSSYFTQSTGGGGSSDDVCFSGDSTLELESGEHKALEDVAIGDRVLTVDSNGKLSYSDVVFLPHGKNNKEAVFVNMAMESGTTLKATPKHLVRTCGGELVAAESVDIGMCLNTKTGGSTVTSKTYTVASGIYSAVTNNEFLVVDGVVASPFAISHAVPHAFYHLHRAIYALAPSFLKSPLASTANALFGALAVGLYSTAATASPLK